MRVRMGPSGIEGEKTCPTETLFLLYCLRTSYRSHPFTQEPVLFFKIWSLGLYHETFFSFFKILLFDHFRVFLGLFVYFLSLDKLQVTPYGPGPNFLKIGSLRPCRLYCRHFFPFFKILILDCFKAIFFGVFQIFSVCLQSTLYDTGTKFCWIYNI